MAKKLTDLLHDFIPTLSSNYDAIFISGLAIDSKVVKPGDLFFAYPGTKSDGREFIANAIEHGAAAIVCEANNFHTLGSSVSAGMTHEMPILSIPDLQSKIGAIAARFYDFPTRTMKMIGITGTNGKTSISHFIARLLDLNGVPCGIVGTLGSGFINKIIPGTHTTPSAIELQKQFAEFNRQNAQAISMEVSSHSLAQGRVNGIDFHTAVFTNLSHDHLDYHGSLDNYGKAKRILFAWPGLKCAVINADDAFGMQLIEEFAPKLQVIAYTLNDISIPNVMMIKVKSLRLLQNGASVDVVTPWGRGTFTTNLMGKFNVSNLLAALGVVGNLGIPFADLLQSLSKISHVNGRMETLGGGAKPLVVVDYAHTPDALEKVLQNLHAHCEGILWCVFGCGGDRDRTKRPVMAQIAENYADFVIVTNDNPRTENPDAIANDIMSGFTSKAKVELELDRQKAINYAVTNAKVHDIVLIAGKGHEDYQIFGTEKVHFSDIEEVNTALNNC